MTRITINIECDLSNELQEELLLIQKMIGRLDGVYSTSYFNETTNSEEE